MPSGVARGKAIIAAAAVLLGRVFSEIFQQRGAAAVGDLRVMHDLLQLGVGDLLLFRIMLLVDELRLLDDISGAEEKQTFAGQSIASGPAGPRIITLQYFWADRNG